MTAPQTQTTDVLDEARPFLELCGPCDAGLPMSCTCPTADYRPLMARLVAEVDEADAAATEAHAILADARDEVRATRAERDRLIDVLARLMSLPSATVADAYAVRYTGRNGVKP